MDNWILCVRRFFSRQLGAEVSELAIVLALIVAAALAVIVVLGPKITQMYADFNNTIP